jgi:carbon monoxide dehydrogenase subunit G
MRYRPIHAALRKRVPFTLWGPSRTRRILAAVAASAVALTPAMLNASPAYAVVNPSSVEDLTITNAGNWEGGKITFTLTYTGTGAGDFDFSTADLPVGAGHAVGDVAIVATDGTDDYVSAPSRSTYTFPGTLAGGNNTVTVTVTTGDDDDTGDETFNLVATDTDSNTTTGTGTIWALPSSLPTFTLVAPSSVPESQSSVTVTAILSTPQDHDVTIPVETVDGTAPTALSSGGVNRDYTALASNAAIVIPAGQVNSSIAVSLWDDNVYEPATQNFKVASTGTALGAGGSASTADIGIVDNDSMPTVSIGDAASVVEGGAGSHPKLYFPVTVSSLSDTPVTVHVSTANGTSTTTSHGATGAAGAAADYTILSDAAVNNAVTIPALNRTVNAVVDTTGDTAVEGTETLTLTLSIPSSTTNATLGTPATATGTITDDDSGPAVTYVAPDATLNGSTFVTGDLISTFIEGDTTERSTYINLSIANSANRQVPLQLNYSFADVTAKNGVDYRGTSGSFSIPVGVGLTAVQIPVTIIGDRIYDPAETFNVVLASPDGTIAPGSLGATPFTIDDTGDVQPTWTTADISVAEGNSGTTMARVPIKLSGPTNVDVTFTAVIAGVSAVDGGISSGTTVGDNDYDLPTVQSATVAAGSTTGYLDIPVNGDAIYEHDESFTVTFTQVGAVVSNTTVDLLQASRVVISNDDAAPTVSLNQLAATEGSTVRVTGTTTGLSQYPYTLSFAVAPTGTSPATATTDYQVQTDPILTATVARGTQGALVMGTLPSTVTTIADVYLVPDDIDEATETFKVTATETTAVLTGIVTTTGTYRINDDPADLPPTASISDESIKENEGSVNLTVSLAFTGETTSSTQPFTVPYSTVNGTAVAGEDYTAKTGTLTIPAGTMSGTINVLVTNDNRAEPDQNFRVNLGSPGPAGASIAKGVGEVTIHDDGDGPASGAVTLKANKSIVYGVGTVTLSGKAAADASVQLWAKPVGNASLVKYGKAVMADSDGDFSFNATLTKTGIVFAATSGGESSDEVTVWLRALPTLTGGSTAKGSASLTVTGNPKLNGQTVTIQRANANGTWSTVGGGKLNSSGMWSGTVKNLKSGSYVTFRAWAAGNGDVGLLSGTSATKRIGIR